MRWVPGLADLPRYTVHRSDSKFFLQFLSHCRHRIRFTAWQGRGASRLGELFEHGQASASWYCWPEGRRSGGRKPLTYHSPRSEEPDKHWHCFEGNFGETAERRCGGRMGLSERHDAGLGRSAPQITLCDRDYSQPGKEQCLLFLDR